jgi:hypothetical protein
MVTKWRNRFGEHRLDGRMGCLMSRGPGSRGRSAMRRSRRSSPRFWRAPRATRRIGQRGRWPPRSA